LVSILILSKPVVTNFNGKLFREPRISLPVSTLPASNQLAAPPIVLAGLLKRTPFGSATTTSLRVENVVKLLIRAGPFMSNVWVGLVVPIPTLIDAKATGLGVVEKGLLKPIASGFELSTSIKFKLLDESKPTEFPTVTASLA